MAEADLRVVTLSTPESGVMQVQRQNAHRHECELVSLVSKSMSQ